MRAVGQMEIMQMVQLIPVLSSACADLSRKLQADVPGSPRYSPFKSASFSLKAGKQGSLQVACAPLPLPCAERTTPWNPYLMPRAALLCMHTALA